MDAPDATNRTDALVVLTAFALFVAVGEAGLEHVFF